MTLFSPTALSIHQLAAQGDLSQVATHLNKGQRSNPGGFLYLSLETPTASGFVLQTVRCSADRMSEALRRSCGQQHLERKQWWTFSWKR